MKTEREKMLAGELYSGEDPELVTSRDQAARLLRTFNAAEGATVKALKALLGAIGEGTTIRAPFHCDYGWNIALGRGVFINFNCVLLDVASIVIGDGCQIGPAVQIYTADHPRDPGVRRLFLESGRPVSVGSNVWIGGGAILLPGVTVGDDAIIGAGSVVTRNVAPGSTVVGNPARLLSSRPASSSSLNG